MRQISTLDGNILPIREFKMEYIADHASIVMVAKRGSGKSWVCRDILQNFKTIPAGIIIAPTDKMNGFYHNFFPDSYIYYDFETDLVKKVLHRQEKIIDKEKEKEKQGKQLDARGFIVMDDCLAQKKTWTNDPTILELLYNGRHYKLMYILTMQYPLGIPPALRSQFDYIFLLAEDNCQNIRRLYDQYAGIFPTFESFKQVFKQLTQDHGCMVIVNTTRCPLKIDGNAGFLEKVFWYKAKNIKAEQMGCGQFNKYHIKNYDENWRQKSKILNIEDFCLQKKREGAAIKIEKVEENDVQE